MKVKLSDVAAGPGMDIMTLRLLAESGKVPFLGAVKMDKRYKYSVEKIGYEAYLRGEYALNIGAIMKEIRLEHN